MSPSLLRLPSLPSPQVWPDGEREDAYDGGAHERPGGGGAGTVAADIPGNIRHPNPRPWDVHL